MSGDYRNGRLVPEPVADDYSGIEYLTDQTNSGGAAAGAATVSGTVAAVKGLVGSSAGVATVNGRLASVKGLTGTVNVSSGGGTTIVRRRKIVIYDKA